MFPACRTEAEGFAIPPFALESSDVEGCIDALQECQSICHDCLTRREPRAHFLDYMVGQCSQLARKSIDPMVLHVEGGCIRGMQRFMSDAVWDEEQMRWNYHFESSAPPSLPQPPVPRPSPWSHPSDSTLPHATAPVQHQPEARRAAVLRAAPTGRPHCARRWRGGVSEAWPPAGGALPGRGSP
jgi:hypothetical protein